MASRNLLLLCLAMSLSTVALPAPETAERTPPKRSPSYSEEGAEGCLRCHAGAGMRAIRSGPHFELRSTAAQAAHHYCEACHGPGSIHVSRAHGGRGFPPLTRFGRGEDAAPREEQLQACMQCHGVPGQVHRTIGFYGSPHDRKNINCSTCHTLHAERDLIGEREAQAATCYRCHRRVRSDHPRFDARSMNIDLLRCSDCHDVHRPLPG